MSYVESSNQRAVYDIRLEEKENLTIHREEGLIPLFSIPSSLGNNLPSLTPRAAK